MQITLRLYYPEDIDLLLLRAYEGRNFCSRITECITACTEGRRYAYNLPESGDCVPGIFPYVTKANLVFSEKSNPEIAAFFQKYDGNSRTSMIKTLLRASFTQYPSKQVLAVLGFGDLAAPAGEAQPTAMKDVSSLTERELQRPSDERPKVIPVAKDDTTALSEQPDAERITPQEKPQTAVNTRVPENQEPQFEPGTASEKAADDNKDRALFEMFLNM